MLADPAPDQPCLHDRGTRTITLHPGIFRHATDTDSIDSSRLAVESLRFRKGFTAISLQLIRGQGGSLKMSAERAESGLDHPRPDLGDGRFDVVFGILEDR